MIPAPFTYIQAESVAHAMHMLTSHGENAKLIAGGHSLVPLMKLRLAAPEVLVDISGLADLSYIRDDGESVLVGALTRHHQAVTSPLVRQDLPLLARAASAIGDPQVRHRGTLGGALAHGDPAADLSGAALALEAVMVLEGPDGPREVPAAEFFLGYWETAVGPDEILTAIRFPKPVESGWGYEKFVRRQFDWAIVGVAVSGAAQPRIGLINVGPVPVRARAAEEAIAAGASVREASELASDGLAPPSDQAATADYRRHLVRVLVGRALTAAQKTGGPS